MKNILKLLGAMAIMGILRDSQRPAPPEPLAKNTLTEPPAQTPAAVILTADQAFDRVATRFGAFAVVAVVSYPFIVASSALRAAAAYDLPALRDERFAIWFTHLASALLTIVALIFAFSAFLPIWSAVERKMAGWRWWVAGLAALPMAAIIMLYILLCIFTLMQSENEIAFGKLAQDLSVAPLACGPNGLHGEICEDALNFCLAQKAERNKCTLTVLGAIGCGALSAPGVSAKPPFEQ